MDRRVTRAALAAALLLAACDPEPEALLDARVELAASTADGLTPMTDGSALAIVLGSQGGYHFDVGVRLYGVDPDGARLRYEVWDTDGSRAYHAEATYALRAGRFHHVGDHLERTGDRAFLAIADPAELAGRTVDVLAILELGDDTRFEDVRTVTAAAPE
jgi:hypothetical protein